MKATRRDFIRTGTGLALAFHMTERLKGNPSSSFDPNAYIHITPGNTVTLWITRSEMGQGVRTTLAVVLAEELEVDLAAVSFEQAMPGQRFHGIRLRTSGSGSASGTFVALRKAAAAREMLVGAAAETWAVDRSACHAERGSVVHRDSGRRLSFRDLATAAAHQPVPAAPTLKDTRDFRLIGKATKRVDAPAIVRGQAVYGLDVRVPGMLVAVMERCPYIGGKAVGIDPAKALSVPGVRHVVPVHGGIFSGVAVVADHTWAAEKGREALRIDWDAGPNRNFDSALFIEGLKTAVGRQYPIRRAGNIADEPGTALKAVYEYPFQAHAPLEPMNAVADVRLDSCQVWVPSQTPETAHENIVKSLGLPPDSVKVHTTLMGGGFGRRLFVDYVDEAVEISRAIGKPVQLVWNRADDMRNGFFHPASVERMDAVIADGTVRAWTHLSVGSDLSMFGLPTLEEKNDRDHYAKEESPWGAFDTPYNFRAIKIDYMPVDSPVPSGSWRAVEYPSRVFAREAFLDEAAHALAKDPFDLRIELLRPGDVIVLGEQRLDRGRMIRVLEEAREKSGWTRPLAIPGAHDRLVGRGLAIGIYHAGSYIAEVAEVSVARDLSDFRVHRIACVVDCGLAINPTGIEGQVESGITWGLSATLHGKIDFREGRVVQSGFHDFRVVHIGEMPVVETHILPSSSPPGGFGEHTVPPVAPAVVNAFFAATGQRIRKLPISLHRTPA